MKVAIVGSRKYENRRRIKDFIFMLKEKYKDGLTIVSGGCKTGADRYAKKYALEFDVNYIEYPPFHQVHNLYCVLPESRYGKPYSVRNFFVRNKIIAKSSDYLAAFIPEGVEANGTMSAIEYAQKFEKKVIIVK
tara:strand:+ start:1046 stop:1447 length:402 start_codon:yes stop_codon:yes gene_type:complete